MDALLNWIWQGCVVAIATAVALRLMTSWRGETRYRAVWIALGSILLLPLVPALWASAAVPAPALTTALPAREPLVALPAAWWTSPLVVMAIWSVWSVVQLIRMALAAGALRRARLACGTAPADLDVRLVRWSMVRDRGRPARLALSQDVRAAAVLGGRTPIIALSPVLLEHLADDEIDRVVMHEWAHVQRRDDLVHLLQMAVRVVAGWHPAVWWCNRQLHLEREIACDEMAVTLTGSVKAYATCLTKLAALPRTATSSLLPVVSVLSPGLRDRIIRILSFDGGLSPRPRGGVMIATGGALVTTAFFVGGFQAVGAMPLQVMETTVMAATEGRGVESPTPVAAAMTSVVAPTDAAVPDTPPDAAEMPRTRRNGQRAERAGAQQAPAAPAPTADAPTSAPAREPPSSAQAPNPGVESSSDAAPSTETRDQTLQQPVEQAPAPAPEPVQPWTAAAETATQTGVAIGRGSQNAAVATAGFFNRLGRKIGGAF